MVGLYMHTLVEVFDGDMHFLDGVVILNLGHDARMVRTQGIWLHFERGICVVEFVLSKLQGAL